MAALELPGAAIATLEVAVYKATGSAMPLSLRSAVFRARTRVESGARGL